MHVKNGYKRAAPGWEEATSAPSSGYRPTALQSTSGPRRPAERLVKTVAIGARNDPPSPTPRAEGSIPADIAMDVMTMGRARL